MSSSPVAPGTPQSQHSEGPSWHALIEPSAVFSHPNEVVAAPNLTHEQKRAILASWASDAWAVESAPALRQCPGLTGRTVPLDDVLGALRALDGQEQHGSRPARSAREEGSRAARRFGRVRWLTPRPAKL